MKWQKNFYDNILIFLYKSQKKPRIFRIIIYIIIK